jgi:predicted transcriptional regulator
MGKFDENMKDIFDLPTTEFEVVEEIDNLPMEVQDNTPVKNPHAPPKSKALKEANDDYEFVRNNLRDTISHAKLALDELNNIASVTEQPRAFEVYAKLIDTINVANKDLLDIHEKMQKIRGEKVQAEQQTSVTNQSIFVGSTTELMRLIKKENE